MSFLSCRGSRPGVRAAWLAALCVATMATSAQAQVHRHIGPDGKVTYSDRPPATATAATTGEAGAGAAGSRRPMAQDGNANLPYALQQVASRFPVVLYTSSGCQPCDNARNWLQTRGIPFAERTVQNNDDIAALQQLSGQNSLPFATMGQQHMVGFSPVQWGEFADAAGYPAQSQLPASYQPPASRPLTPRPEIKPGPAPTADAQPRNEAPAQPRDHERERPPPGTPTPDNPKGIIF